MHGRHRTIVVEDERLARLELCSLLAREPTISVIGEAASLEGARRLMTSQKPDVVFLDVQLGYESGFDLLDDGVHDFEVVFVTAYNHHAVRAFELNALDYLLKPVDAQRLHEAVTRIGSPRAVAQRNDTSLEPDDRLFVQVDDGWRFVRVSEITCVMAKGDVSQIHLADRSKILIHRTLKSWEACLPQRLFLRIHRSTIVNLDFVTGVQEWSGQTFHVHVRGLTEPLSMSRRYAARLKA